MGLLVWLGESLWWRERGIDVPSLTHPGMGLRLRLTVRLEERGGREQGRDPHEQLWAPAPSTPSREWVLTRILEKRKAFPIPVLVVWNINV